MIHLHPLPYKFKLLFSSKYGLNQRPYENLIDYNLTPKMTSNIESGILIRDFLIVFDSNVWSNLVHLQDANVHIVNDLDLTLNIKSNGVRGRLIVLNCAL